MGKQVAVTLNSGMRRQTRQGCIGPKRHDPNSRRSRWGHGSRIVARTCDTLNIRPIAERIVTMSGQPQVIHTLDTKRLEIESHIGSLEQDLEQARRDLSAVLATIKVFSADGPRVTAYMNLSRLFPRHLLPKLAKAALGASPAGVSTVGIAAHVIAAKGPVPRIGGGNAAKRGDADLRP